MIYIYIYIFINLCKGTILLWDIRRTSMCMNRNIDNIHDDDDDTYYVRPTYSTESTVKTHTANIIKLLPLSPMYNNNKYKYNNNNSNNDSSIQIASIDSRGVTCVWVIIKLSSNEYSIESEIDLGLDFGGKIKLVKTSKIHFDMSKYIRIYIIIYYN